MSVCHAVKEDPGVVVRAALDKGHVVVGSNAEHGEKLHLVRRDRIAQVPMIRQHKNIASVVPSRATFVHLQDTREAESFTADVLDVWRFPTSERAALAYLCIAVVAVLFDPPWLKFAIWQTLHTLIYSHCSTNVAFPWSCVGGGMKH